MSDGVKLGQLLCDADIITKRQLSKALQAQVGNKGTIGEILVEMGFCDLKILKLSQQILKNMKRNTKKFIKNQKWLQKNKPEPKKEISEDIRR